MSTTHPTYGYKERRREAHTQAEQKRRDAIKKGYEDLQHLVPTCQQHDSISSYKLSKATILQRSIDHIQAMQKAKHKHENDLKILRKEVCALQIMKNNYEQMLKQHHASSSRQQQQQQLLQQQQPEQPQIDQANEQLKFEIFQAFCESLFESFDRCVSFVNFKLLSASLCNWLEEHGKPQNLREMCIRILPKHRVQSIAPN